MSATAEAGLQAERTALAWRRTALSVTVASLVGLRLLPPKLGALGYAVSALGLLWALELALASLQRYGDARRLAGTGAAAGGATSAGAAMARTAVIGVLVALGALVAVVVLSTR